LMPADDSSQTPPEQSRDRTPLGARDRLQFLKGVGPRRATALAKQGFETVEDLLYHLPFRWEDRSAFARVADVQPRVASTLAVEIVRQTFFRKRKFSLLRTWVTDGSGQLETVWFNQPWLAKTFTAGQRLVLHGRPDYDRSGKLVLSSPEYEILDEDDEAIHTGRIVPVYRKTGELNSRTLRTVLWTILDQLDESTLPDLVPEQVAGRHDLLSRVDALRSVHFPEPGTAFDELRQRRTPGYRSLMFEEIFLLQLALAVRRQGLRNEQRGIAYEVADTTRLKLKEILPFKLTAAQKRVIREIGADLKSDRPMNRLLQGDVGSGKTIVALLTMLIAAENGYQAALMAPTEILAEQHFRTITKMLSGTSMDRRTVLLTGSLRASARRQVLGEMQSGAAELVVGTHSLFQGGAPFRKLGLVVVDEQHRFGVMQRAALAAKGQRPDMLVMTATPIPRSLALTLYGDLDMSVIDELPPGRTPIKTYVRTEEDREKVYRGVRREIDRGHQVYLVVPLVEESERVDLKAAVAFAEHLRSEVFPDYTIEMVHGRLKSDAKDAAMQRFVRGEAQLLVATTVVEVGVDVPNASVMIIEHAERFGLSQLHQLRGRVGRGAARSYCVLMVAEGQGEDARERLAVMERTTDGFEIAETDLAIRGPGAVFGTQQHGLSDMAFLAEILRSPAVLETARIEAQNLVGAPGGEERCRQILASVGTRWQKRLELAEVV
ncbi:ATP-dependent DNA helicase RecG, partial [bacterium]|nr:ATP-dependent DNA helicase RecG [bacterium]